MHLYLYIFSQFKYDNYSVMHSYLYIFLFNLVINNIIHSSFITFSNIRFNIVINHIIIYI